MFPSIKMWVVWRSKKCAGKEMEFWVEGNVEDSQDSCLITHVSLGDDVQAGFAHALGNWRFLDCFHHLLYLTQNKKHSRTWADRKINKLVLPVFWESWQSSSDGAPMKALSRVFRHIPNYWIAIQRNRQGSVALSTQAQKLQKLGSSSKIF